LGVEVAGSRLPSLFLSGLEVMLQNIAHFSNIDRTQLIKSFLSINQSTNSPLSIQNREVLLQLRQGIPVESQFVYDVLDKSKMLTVNIYLYNKKGMEGVSMPDT
jgi:hypothetical protein